MINEKGTYEFDKVLEGAEANRYANEKLERIWVDHEKGEIGFVDRKTTERWIMDFPQSEYHGDGPPRLRRINK